MLKYRLWRIKNSFTAKTETTLKYKRLNPQVAEQSTNIINAVGYVIFAVVIINYCFLLSSAQFYNADWIHSTVGSIVENAWGLLLGFLFVFYRCDQDIVKPREFFILKIISWLALLIGISYFAISPLLIGNAFRINRNAKAQVVQRTDAANFQVEQYSQQLNQATDEQLAGILKNYQQQAPDLNIASTTQLKETLITQARQKQQQVKQNLQNKLQTQQKKLFKTTIKWSMIATLTGTCLLLIWKYTLWARTRY